MQARGPSKHFTVPGARQDTGRVHSSKHTALLPVTLHHSSAGGQDLNVMAGAVQLGGMGCRSGVPFRNSAR